MKFWSAIALQLLAVTLRDLKSRESLVTDHCPLQPEVVCHCEVAAPAKGDRLYGLSLFGLGFVVGLITLAAIYWACGVRRHAVQSSPRSPRGRRRGGGVLSSSEAREESSALVS